jgi:hypothetical protein
MSALFRALGKVVSCRGIPSYDPAMPFDASRWPNAVTVADLIERAMQLGVHCLTCGRHRVIEPATLPLASAAPVPSLAGRFKCTRCGSRQTEARPEYPSEGRLTGYA